MSFMKIKKKFHIGFKLFVVKCWWRGRGENSPEEGVIGIGSWWRGAGVKSDVVHYTSFMDVLSCLIVMNLP